MINFKIKKNVNVSLKGSKEIFRKVLAGVILEEIINGKEIMIISDIEEIEKINVCIKEKMLEDGLSFLSSPAYETNIINKISSQTQIVFKIGEPTAFESTENVINIDYFGRYEKDIKVLIRDKKMVVMTKEGTRKYEVDDYLIVEE